MAFISGLAIAGLFGAWTAEAATILPLSIERSRVSLGYFEDELVSSGVFSYSGFDPIDSGFVVSSIGTHEVSGSLFARGTDTYSEELEQRVTFRLDFELTEASAYTLDATLELEQFWIGDSPDSFLGDAIIEFSFFDSDSSLFLPLHSASGLSCVLVGPPCEAVGAADSDGGFEFVLSRAGTLPAGLYRLEAFANAWGTPHAFENASDGTDGHARVNFTFELVPEPTTVSLIGLGVVLLLASKPRRSSASGQQNTR